MTDVERASQLMVPRELDILEENVVLRVETQKIHVRISTYHSLVIDIRFPILLPHAKLSASGEL